MSFKAFLLCLLILVLGIFIYLKAETLGSSGSSFNQTTRYMLGRYELLRSLFALHKDGDARAQYLIGTSPIDIEIVQTGADQLPDYVVQQFDDQVTAITGRATITYSMDVIPAGTLTDSDIAHIVQVDKKQINIGHPILFIIYADDFTSSSQEIAKTVEEFGMVISNDKLTSVTSDYNKALPQYQESTMLHEFGHQLGLDHNQQEGCVMNAAVEDPSPVGSFSSDYTPTQFCQFELDQLTQIKAGF